MPKWESNRAFFQFVINLTPKYDFGEKCPNLTISSQFLLKKAKFVRKCLIWTAGTLQSGFTLFSGTMIFVW